MKGLLLRFDSGPLRTWTAAIDFRHTAFAVTPLCYIRTTLLFKLEASRRFLKRIGKSTFLFFLFSPSIVSPLHALFSGSSLLLAKSTNSAHLTA